ncbi:hypothetical protein E9229_003233 [Paeniglutamicibacter cryotolerans]|uniref:Uncharacterized protein n=1 Tax=Paeniglutamicibacter cryotolerans TaxID=670079 RepID=A0A839QSP7_9MICC|nr:hypothetical protein [Paeniglutamicibacter cryotolerans]
MCDSSAESDKQSDGGEPSGEPRIALPELWGALEH